MLLFYVESGMTKEHRSDVVDTQRIEDKFVSPKTINFPYYLSFCKYKTKQINKQKTSNHELCPVQIYSRYSVERRQIMC